MDKEYIRDIFEQKRRDDRLIKYGDLIDEEAIKILSMASRANIDKAFYQYTRSEISSLKATYRICFKCPHCGELQTKEVNKVDALDIIKRVKMNDYDRYENENQHMKKYLCDDCYSVHLRKKENEKKEYIEEKVMLTLDYIFQYLSPDRRFNKDIKPYQKINVIMEPTKYQRRYAPMQPYYDDIERRIKSMNYHDFLKTPFWDGVRNYKLRKANYCCELCGGKGILNVHHKTYENHGKEFDPEIADADLIVLCKNCHEKFHDKVGRVVEQEVC